MGTLLLFDQSHSPSAWWVRAWQMSNNKSEPNKCQACIEPIPSRMLFWLRRQAGCTQNCNHNCSGPEGAAKLRVLTALNCLKPSLINCWIFNNPLNKQLYCSKAFSEQSSGWVSRALGDSASCSCSSINNNNIKHINFKFTQMKAHCNSCRFFFSFFHILFLLFAWGRGNNKNMH